jgi:hypothetical protein
MTARVMPESYPEELSSDEASADGYARTVPNVL